MTKMQLVLVELPRNEIMLIKMKIETLKTKAQVKQCHRSQLFVHT